jgi:hypothetical protein
MSRVSFRWPFVFALLLLLWIPPFAIFAEVPSQENVVITGKVVDPQQIPVPDARVTLSIAAQTQYIGATTDHQGSFTFTQPISLTTGTPITLTVEATGFQTWKSEGLSLEKNSFFAITLTPNPAQNFVTLLFLFVPGLLGLLAWIAIRGWDEWGKRVTLTLLFGYIYVLMGWVAWTQEWLDKTALSSGPGPLSIVIGFLAMSAVLLIAREGVLRIIAWITKRNPPSKTNADKLRGQALWFLGVSAALWVLGASSFFYAYLQYHVAEVSVFQPLLVVPFLVPVFALLGVVVVVVRTINDHFEDDVSTLVYSKTLATAGERLLIGPYIAIVADFVLFHPVLDQIKALSAANGTLPAEAFLAFFTGLYVIPVLNRLGDLGNTLLTKAAQEKKQTQEDDEFKMLGMNPDLALRLREQKVTTIEDLKNLKEGNIQSTAKAIGVLSEDQLREWRKMACLYWREIDALRDLVGLKADQIAELRRGQIASLEQLMAMEKAEIKQSADVGSDEEVGRIKARIEIIFKCKKEVEAQMKANNVNTISDLMKKDQTARDTITNILTTEEDTKDIKIDMLIEYFGIECS